MNTQRIGGIAAFLEAACYIVGFCIFIFFLDPPSQLDPVGSVKYLIANETLILAAMIFIYIFAALVLFILVLALHDRLKTARPRLMALATSLGIIWAGIVIASGMIFVSGSQTVIGLHAVDPERAGTVWLAVGCGFCLSACPPWLARRCLASSITLASYWASPASSRLFRRCRTRSICSGWDRSSGFSGSGWS